MPATRSLTLQIIQVDILARGEVIGTAVRLTTGYWQFRDLENDWREEYPMKLEVDQLLDTFREIRKRRGIAARSARKGK